MKNLLIAFCLVALNSLPSSAQMNDIFAAIRSGNAESLSRYFDTMVEVCINDNPAMYTKKEATDKVAQFFKQNRPSSFQEMHQGSSKGKDSKYTIGQLNTSGGNYRVFIFVTQTGKGTTIQELRFDKG
jgi:hypothetical protein